MSDSTEEEIKIRGEFTPDPEVCRFSVNRPLLDEGAVACPTVEDGLGSPLVEALYGIEGIGAVRISGSTLTLTKNTPDPWPKVAAQLIPVVRALIESGADPISAELRAKVLAGPSAGEMTEVVTKLLDEHINPALASHGGWVRLHRIEDRDVYLEMGGGCQGCSMSQATLKNGIEQSIRDAVPQVREIIDATDHEAGANPYYT